MGLFVPKQIDGLLGHLDGIPVCFFYAAFREGGGGLSVKKILRKTGFLSGIESRKILKKQYGIQTTRHQARDCCCM